MIISEIPALFKLEFAPIGGRHSRRFLLRLAIRRYVVPLRVKRRRTIVVVAVFAIASALVLLPSSKPGRITARIVGKGQRMGDEAFLYFEVVNTTSRPHLLTFWSESRDGNEWKRWRTGPLSFTIAANSTNKASAVCSATGVRRVVLAFDPVRTNRLDKWLTRLKSYIGVKPKKPFTLYVEE